MEEKVSLDDLLKSEKTFLNLCMPSYSIGSEEVLAQDCCANQCVYFLRRFDVLTARYHYTKFHYQLDSDSRRKSRILFISTIARISDTTIEFVPINQTLNVCPILLCRVFGFSLHVLLNGIGDQETSHAKTRPWYKKTVETLSSALHSLSTCAQFNSLDQLMVPRNFSSRSSTSESFQLPVAMLRKRMDLKIRQRKNDSLTRCTACCLIPEVFKAATNEDDRKEADETLQVHHRIVSQQRSILGCLAIQSRDDETDVTVCLMDSMSNKWTKLPSLVSRPKTIGDADRVLLNLATVQLCQNHGSHLFRNVEFPSIQGLYGYDSNYYLSIFMEALTNLTSIASHICIIMDSCSSNKSFMFMAGIGFLLSRLRYVKNISMLYPPVGHTHNSVDAHFGVVSKKMVQVDIKDPIEFSEFLHTIPSVTKVIRVPTIFDFSAFSDMMYKPVGLCSNGMITISRSSSGLITYSSSLTMSSSQLIGAESNQISKKLFKDEFYSSTASPSICIPDASEAVNKITALINGSAAIFSEFNKENFKKSYTEYGTKAFRQLVLQINSIPPKTRISNILKLTDSPTVVVDFLKKHNIKTGRVPREPKYQSSQLLD